MAVNISIIIVSWNAKKFLEQCLRSLVECGIDAEIIVVDNFSTDGSVELVLEKFASVRLVQNTSNLGFAKANNAGMLVSNGDYVFLINSDVIVNKKCLDLMVEYLQEHQETGLIGPGIRGIDGSIQRSCMGNPSFWNIFCRAFFLDTLFPRSSIFNGFMLNHLDRDSIREVDVINGCFWLVRRTAVDQVGMLDESFFMYGEDMDWCKRFKSANWKVVYFPIVEAIHYGGASSANAPVKFFVEMQKANLHYWHKHYGRFSGYFYRCLIISHHLLRVLCNMVRLIIKPSEKNRCIYKTKRSISAIAAML